MYLKPQMFGLANEVAAVKASFLCVAIWWIVFSLPVFLFVKEPAGTQHFTLGNAIKSGFSQLGETFRSIKLLKVTGLFLIAYWCYIDGVDTIIRMAVDYGTALGFPSSSLIIALLITQFVAFPAALGYNWFGHKIGIKRALLVAIGGYSLIAIFGCFMTKPIHFYILAVAIGLFQGGIQALSRSFYTRLIPKQQSAQFFGFFNMLGKFAAIIGPLLVGIVTVMTGSNRIGIVSLVILFVAGGIILTKVDEKQAAQSLATYNQQAGNITTTDK